MLNSQRELLVQRISASAIEDWFDVSFQSEKINKRLHPLIKGLHEIMRSRLSKSTASGLIIGARDYYPKVILLFVL